MNCPSSHIVLVTGAGGFIGRAVAKQLIKAGHHVRPVARQAGRLDGGTRIAGVGEMSLTTEWQDVLGGVTCVVHCAARAHRINDKNAESVEAFRAANVEAALRLAEQTAQQGVRRFIFVSSIGVNGNRTIKPFTELDAPNPAEGYAQSKLEAELALRQLARNTGLELAIVRPPLVYGPDAPGNFGRLLRLVKTGFPLPLGAAAAPRSFVALDNLVDFISTLVAHPRAAGELFLVSDGRDLSTAELLRLIAKGLDKPLRLVSVPQPVLLAVARAFGRGAMIDRLTAPLQIDISKARNVLGWQPPVRPETAVPSAVSGQRLGTAATT